MKRTIVPALACLALFAGCDNQPSPQAPPTQEDALTTATAAPITQAPVDDVVETTEPAPVTSEPTEEPTANDNIDEHSEEGAIAFVEHYLDTYNYAFANADPSAMEGLSTPDCLSCAGITELIPTDGEPGFTYLRYRDPRALIADDSGRVSLTIDQAEHGGEPATTVQALFTLDHSDEGWLVDEIQIEQQ
ncbi:DUF6318 family protein [Ornithinimicrobium sp. Y1694]|uniref:DUF6318 family protein n=1 Tax=Ornithinimicrobium sp. Y1694 TaxID=3418590 RepID=UPI003CE6A029